MSSIVCINSNMQEQAKRMKPKDFFGSHRKKGAKAIGANPLDEIAGVGASRKRALLQHFDSAAAGASLIDLKAVEDIGSALAKKIYDFFHVSG